MLNTCPHDLETPELELQGLLKMGKNRHFWGQKSRFRGQIVECLEKLGNFKSRFNYEFLIFFIHSRCKTHLHYSKNLISKKNWRARPCARAVFTWKYRKSRFSSFFSLFFIESSEYSGAQRARKCARAKHFGENEISWKNRYVLHQKRVKNLWNLLRNNQRQRGVKIMGFLTPLLQL